MRFSTILAVVLPVATAFAQGVNHVVQVGANDTLTFMPNNIEVQNGDSVSFQFLTKNHTVTQSTFATPCTMMPNGVDSGFQFVPANSTTIMQWTFTVNNASAPLWFYCRQATHCEQGMVFAINPSATKTFAAYQAAAMATVPNTTNTTTSSSGSSSAGAIASTIAAGTSSSASASPSASTTSSGAASGAVNVKAGSAVGLLLTGVGMVAALVL